jgi:hypothetical protein
MSRKDKPVKWERTVAGRERASKREPWERQEHETSLAFRAFTIYRDMSPAQRNLAAVADELGCSYANVSGLSSRHHWKQRLRDYEDHLALVSHETYEAEVKAAAVRQAALAVEMQDIVAAGLKAIDPETLEVGDLIRMFDVSVRVERKARRMDEAIAEDKTAGFAINQAPLRRALSNPTFVTLLDQLGAHLHDGSTGQPALEAGADAGTDRAGDAGQSSIDAEWREVGASPAPDTPQ